MATRQIQCKIDESSYEMMMDFFDRSGEKAIGSFIEMMIEEYARPRKLEDHHKELEGRIAELEQQLAERGQQLEESERKANSNAESANQQQLEYESKMAALNQQLADGQLKENQHVVTFIPENWKALELVAARESRRRNQQWTPSHVVNFFVHSRFIKGELNGDLKSIDDSDLRKAGIKIEKKQNFEI